MTVARNIRHTMIETKEGKKTVPEIEAVLTTFDKAMEFHGGSMVNVERTNTIRFQMTTETARNFAENLHSWANEAEEQSESLVIEEQA